MALQSYDMLEYKESLKDVDWDRLERYLKKDLLNLIDFINDKYSLNISDKGSKSELIERLNFWYEKYNQIELEDSTPNKTKEYKSGGFPLYSRREYKCQSKCKLSPKSGDNWLSKLERIVSYDIYQQEKMLHDKILKDNIEGEELEILLSDQRGINTKESDSRINQNFRCEYLKTVLEEQFGSNDNIMGNLIPIKKIGEGTHGTVFLLCDDETGVSNKIVKIINQDKYEQDLYEEIDEEKYKMLNDVNYQPPYSKQEFTEMVTNEVLWQNDFSYLDLTFPVDYYLFNNNYDMAIIVMDRLDGTLQDILLDTNPESVILWKKMLDDLGEIIDTMNNNKIFHLDLKPNNIGYSIENKFRKTSPRDETLISSDYKLYLLDFGAVSTDPSSEIILPFLLTTLFIYGSSEENKNNQYIIDKARSGFLFGVEKIKNDDLKTMLISRNTYKYINDNLPIKGKTRNTYFNITYNDLYYEYEDMFVKSETHEGK